MNLFVFEMIWHLEYQIQMMNIAIKLTSNEKHKNIYAKECKRHKLIRTALKSIPRIDAKFTTSHTNVKQFIFSKEFTDQLNTLSATSTKR